MGEVYLMHLFTAAEEAAKVYRSRPGELHTAKAWLDAEIHWLTNHHGPRISANVPVEDGDVLGATLVEVMANMAKLIAERRTKQRVSKAPVAA